MKIAIYTKQPDTDDCQLLLTLIDKLTNGTEILLRDFEQVFMGDLSLEMDAVFACVSDMRSLEGVRKLVRQHIPLVIVSKCPDFAMEGIRLGICYYIIQPPTEIEIKTALERLLQYRKQSREESR